MSVKLYIGGLPFEMDEMQLAQLMGLHGRIDIMKIVRDKRSGAGKGYAFVEMSTEADAAAVIAALDGVMIMGRTLNVKLANIAPVKPGSNIKRRSTNFDPDKKLRPKRPRLD